MKNVLLLLLFIVALASCTIEKRRYFNGYYVENGGMGKWENGKTGKRDPSTSSGTTHSTGSGTGEMRKREIGEEGKREGVLEEQCAKSEAEKPQRGDIVIAGDIVIPGDIIITSPADITTANSPSPSQNTARVIDHKKSHALEGLGVIFLIGIITLVVIVGLIIFLLSDSAIAGLIGGLLIGLFAAIGIYLLLLAVFFALLFFIIKTFGA